MGSSKHFLGVRNKLLKSVFTPTDSPYNKTGLKIGQNMPDGSIYVGISKTTKTNLFTYREDSGVMSWYEMVHFAEQINNLNGWNGSAQSTEEKLLEAIGNKSDDGGWRAPTIDELNQLFINKNKIGGFSHIDLCYWSSSEYDGIFAKCQELNYGFQFVNAKINFMKFTAFAVRLVRSEPSGVQ